MSSRRAALKLALFSAMLALAAFLVQTVSAIPAAQAPVSADSATPEPLNFDGPAATQTTGRPPQIKLEPATVAVGQPLQLRALVDGHGRGSQRWELGDGRVIEVSNPLVVYATPGTYLITLQVTGPAGPAAAAASITVVSAPAAAFELANLSAAANQPLAFINTSGGLSPLAYRWDFGDGVISNERSPKHVYPAPGSYPVRLTVTNAFGSSEFSQLVTITSGTEPAAEGNPAGETEISRVFLPLTAWRPAPPEEMAQALAATTLVHAPLPELPALDLAPGLNPVEQLLAYINEARRLNGLNALALVPALSLAAQHHSDDMAANGHTSHVGSDGSRPAQRLRAAGYGGGYGGEATAWGMPFAKQPVRFWLASAAHRPILLHPGVDQVGIGYTKDFDSPSGWYWTAEFASMRLPVLALPPLPTATPSETPAAAEQPSLELLAPAPDGLFLLAPGVEIAFSWRWPEPLAAKQRFVLYGQGAGRTVQW
ncbi:MAG: PKD domain-containing protein, partial [Candidatus Promineifilaceae bacterium]